MGWCLFPVPVYLILRGRRVPRTTAISLVWFGALQVSVVAGMALASAPSQRFGLSGSGVITELLARNYTGGPRSRKPGFCAELLQVAHYPPVPPGSKPAGAEVNGLSGLGSSECFVPML